MFTVLMAASIKVTAARALAGASPAVPPSVTSRSLVPVVNLSVRDNLMMGGALYNSKAQLNAKIEQWFVQFPTLRERSDQLAGTLSGGEQQMLAISRALLSNPRILLLDEPSLGLAPQIVSKIFGIIRDLKAQGTTILLVEQNAAAAVSVSDYVYVLNNGVIYIHGQTDQFGHGSELMNELTGVYV